MPTLNLESIALLTAVTLLFAIQMYYIWLYSRTKRVASRQIPASEQGVSVVILVHESFDFATNILPAMLSQEHPKFEIVLVDVGSSEEFLCFLNEIGTTNQHLKITPLKRDNRFKITTKMAYNVGIKAASYNNIILSTNTTLPSSTKWLAAMASGFDRGSVVLGYCAVERTKGLCNRIIRTSRAMSSLRYLASAVDGRPYRGTIQNVGFTKDEYFAAKGFNHLNMNIGEDDLFIQKIATASNTAIVLHPDATPRQTFSGVGVPSWGAQRRVNCYSRNLYPQAIKQYLSLEVISRLLFLITATIGLVSLPLYFKIGVAVLVVTRFVLLSLALKRFSKIVGDKGVTLTLIINDVMSPFSELRLLLLRKVISPKALWR